MLAWLQTPTSIFLQVALLSTALTGATRWIAKKVGFISRPAKDRWNTREVALGGGIAIHLSVLISLVFWLPTATLFSILPAFLLVFVLGVIDDIRGTSAAGKLVVQAIAAAWAVSQGYMFPLPSASLSMAVTILWVVGVCNAVNLIDNMDGLAAGASVIASAAFAFLFFGNDLGSAPYGIVAVVLSGACLGFLVHNFNPAKIFMGDTGSLGIGFLLATLATKVRVSHIDIPDFVVLLPVAFILIVPLFDTCLVMVARKSASRPLTSGGRDHTSHRLVALGLGEKTAVLLLYLFGVLGFVAAYFALNNSLSIFLALTAAMIVVVTLFGIFLLDIAVYPQVPLKKSRSSHQSLPDPILFITELALDIFIICLAWGVAHLVRFYDTGQTSYYKVWLIVPWLPFVITSKVVAVFSLKLYRGVWKQVTLSDTYHILQAATLGTLILVLGLAVFTRLQDVSRIVLVLDWLLTFLGLFAARSALIGMRYASQRLAATPARAALLGPSALLPMAKKALEKEIGIEFSGVIATDSVAAPFASGILGRQEDLDSLLENAGIDVLFITTDPKDPRLAKLETKGILLRNVTLQFSS